MTVLGRLKNFDGIWLNINNKTRGVTRLKISVNGTQVSICAWGACHPTDCNWGWIEATPLVTTVCDDLRDTDSLIAVWKPGFAINTVVLFHNNDTLTAQVITIFRDNSGRSDMLNNYALRRPRP